MLGVSKFTTVKMKNDVGQVARWVMRGPAKEGVIFQYVEHRYQTSDMKKPMVNKFTECWRVRKHHDVEPGHGEDYFLVPKSVHKNSGEVCIAARAWFVECDFYGAMQELDMCDPEVSVSGVLWSNPGQVPSKYQRPGGVCRLWMADWQAVEKASDMRLDVTSKIHEGTLCKMSGKCKITAT